MAETKRLKTRFVQKHDIEANWIRAASFIPLQGEVIIYDAETQSTFDDGVSKLSTEQLELLGRTEPITYQRIKVGDGINSVTNLPFVGGGSVDFLQNDEFASDFIKNSPITYKIGSVEFEDSNWYMDGVPVQRMHHVKIGLPLIANHTYSFSCYAGDESMAGRKSTSATYSFTEDELNSDSVLITLSGTYTTEEMSQDITHTIAIFPKENSVAFSYNKYIGGGDLDTTYLLISNIHVVDKQLPASALQVDNNTLKDTNGVLYATTYSLERIDDSEVWLTRDDMMESSIDSASTNFVTEKINAATENLATKDEIPTKVSELENDSGYLTEHQSLDGYATETFVTQKIAEAELNDKEVDLSDYATKEYVDNKLGDYEGDVNITGNAKISGDVEIGGNLKFDGEFEIGNLTVTSVTSDIHMATESTKETDDDLSLVTKDYVDSFFEKFTNAATEAM